MNANDPVIDCRALTKTYGRARGITSLTLPVAAGEFYGFIGPNGAGKSTTIRTLLGLCSPTAGSARVLGLSPENAAQRCQLLARVGYLPSEAQFYPDMKVREVIALSARLRGKNCTAEANRLCDRLELDVNRRIDQLSLGNRKKTGIVCAMQHDPELYILDEPTSGLDPLMQQVFFELLEEKHDRGATVFFSSHVLGEVQRHCTRAAVLREGRLAAEGSVAELTGTSARRVVLSGEGLCPPALAGVSAVQQLVGQVSFLYSGPVAPLLAALAALPAGAVRDVTITEPSLEDVFMHYYQQEA